MDIYTLEFSIDPADLAVFKQSPIVITKSSDKKLVPAWISFIPTIPVAKEKKNLDSGNNKDASEKPQPLTYTISFSPSDVVYGYILSDEKAYKPGLMITQQFDQEVDFMTMKFDGQLFKKVNQQTSDDEDEQTDENENTDDDSSYSVVNQSSYPNMLFGLSNEPLFTGNFRILKPGIKAVNAHYTNSSVGSMPTNAQFAKSSLKNNPEEKSDKSTEQQSKIDSILTKDENDAATPAKFSPTETISVFTLPTVNSQELLPAVPTNAATFTFSKNQANAKATYDPEQMVFVIAPA